MSNASEMTVTITGDASSALGALSSFASAVEGTATGVKSQLAGVQTAVNSLMAPLAAITAVLSGGMFLKSAATATVDWTVAAVKLSKTLGITTEEASALGVAVKNVHGDADTFLSMTAKMTRNLNTNEDAFHKLGIATRDSAGHLRGSEDIMLDSFAALGKLKEGTDRNVASTQIFGKSWLEVYKYLGLNKAAIEEARDQAERLNLIVGSDSVEAVEAFRKSSEHADLALTGLKIRMGKELLPVLEQFNQEMSDDGPTAISVLGGAMKGLMEIVDGAFSGFKMFAIGLGGLIWAIYGTLKTVLTTTWGFLSAGIPGAKKAWADGNKEMSENWTATLDALEEKSNAYQKRQNERWNPTTKAAKPSVPGADGHADTKQHGEKEDTFKSDMIHLDEAALAYADKTTLAKEKQNELDKLALKYKQELLEIDKKQKEGHLTAGEAGKEKAKAGSNNDLAKAGIDANYAKKQQDEDNKVRSVELGSEKSHQAAVYNLKIQGIKDQEALGQISAQDAIKQINALEETKFQAEKAALEKELAQDGQKPEKIAQINAAILALQDKHEADMAKLHQQETLELQKTDGWAGFLAGLKSTSDQAKNIFAQMKGFATSLADTLSNSLGKAFQDILTKGATFASVMKSLMSSLTTAIISGLTQMAAKQVVNWGVEKAVSAWKSMDHAKTIAMDNAKIASSTTVVAAQKGLNAEAVASDTATGVAQQGVAEQTMAAKVYAFYAGMGPWGIPAAIATIAGVILAISQVGKITAHATGGIIDQPTLALMGEAGPEIVAPKNDFNNWAHANQNLGYNLGQHASQVSSLQAQASSYGASAQAQAQSGVGPTHVHLEGAIIAGESVESSRIIGNMVKKQMDNYNRRNG